MAWLCRRNTVGARWPISPRGRQIINNTIATPNTSMRYWSRPRNSSKPPIMVSAASATPSCEPMPPSTTIASTSADSWKVNDSGLMKPWRVAKNAPAKPPNIAPVANAVSLVVVVLMPSARQATSSSRKASQARPIVTTAFGNLDTAVRAMEGGAFDYLVKPFDLDQAVTVVGRALESKRSRLAIDEHRVEENDKPARAGGHVADEPPALIGHS